MQKLNIASCVVGRAMLQEFSAWLFQILPWLSDVVPWLSALKELWDKIESVFLVAALLFVVRKLKSERVKIAGLIEDLGERVDTAGQIANAAREAAETSMSRPAGPVPYQVGSTANWEIIREDWQETRDRIELAIKRIKHKGTRAKYGNINRHSYADVINMLKDDGALRSSASWMALLNMNQKFLALRTKTNAVSPDDVAQFKSWLRDVNGTLPKLPHPPTPKAQAGTMLQAAE